MYSVTIKDHIMIAHSLNDRRFGPAKNLHGATYVIEATFKAPELNDMSIVIDISAATELLRKVSKKLNYKNLDDMEEFKNQLTTTEYLAKYIHDTIKKEISTTIKLKITLHESHVASASYEG